MNDTATTARVPSPKMAVSNEAPAANLPTTTEPANRPGHAPAPTLPAGAFGTLVGAIAAVMEEIQPIEKGGKNTFHDYKYARMQDILAGLTPLMGKHGIVVFQYEFGRQMFDDGRVLAIQYNFVVAHKSGETWLSPVPQTGMSPCRTSRGTFDDKSFAKCHTSARKYFLLSLFQIPTEDEDADSDTTKRGSNAPVPGPTGYTPPHRIEPVRGETSDTWATKYESHVKHAKTAAELVKWDEENDGLLSTLNEKAPERYAKVIAYVATLQAALASGFVRDASPAKPTEQATADKITDMVARPEGCPNADQEPDAFLAWADKRMAAITDPEALEVVFHNEIDPASDGLMKPDYAALQAVFAVHQKRLGSD